MEPEPEQESGLEMEREQVLEPESEPELERGKVLERELEFQIQGCRWFHRVG